MTTTVIIKAHAPEGKKVLVDVTGPSPLQYLLESGKEMSVVVWGDQAVSVREIFAEEK